MKQSTHNNNINSNYLFHSANNKLRLTETTNSFISSRAGFFQPTSLFSARFGNSIVALYSNGYSNPDKTAGLFLDICKDIDNAQQNIVITAWAINVGHDFGMKDKKTLAERLYLAAQRGVKITILMWDTIVPTEHRDLPEMKKFINAISQHPNIFNNVSVKKCHRATGYSDHQKMVVIDGEKLYIGGMDLTSRRDDPDRWHDSHIAITGPCVKDALKVVQAHWHAVKEKNCIAPLFACKNIIDNNGSHNLKEAIALAKSKSDHLPKSNNNGTMQIVVGMKRKYFNNEKKWQKTYVNLTHTCEIQKTHLSLISNAKRFLYLENQNFTGPYFHHDSCNLVLNAIINKIVEMHKQGKPFHFYALLPIFHGASPTPLPLQLLMQRQWKTIEWFIATINQKTNGHAADYITFMNSGRQIYADNKLKFIQKYTHAKLLIADDNEMILGSANITERSMAEDRDSEVIIHLKGQKKEIKDYRVRLFKEHFSLNKFNHSLLNSPEQKETIDTLNLLLENNLKKMYADKSGKHVYVMPWGNMPKSLLMQGNKPQLVQENHSLLSELLMHIPYTNRMAS